MEYTQRKKRLATLSETHASNYTTHHTRRYTMRRFLVIALLFIFATCAQAYEVYIVTPPINDYLIPAEGPLPPTCQLGNALDIMACRGEYEPASFVIQTEPDEHLDNVRIYCGPLRSGEDTIPASAVDIRIVDKLNVGWAIGNVKVSWHLLYDQAMIDATDDPPANVGSRENQEAYTAYLEHIDRIFGKTGALPQTVEEYRLLWKQNILVKASDAKSLRPVQVDGREQMWLTVHVPQDAPAGNYEARVRVVPENAPTALLTLRVWVPDIDLLEPVETYSIYNPTFTLRERWNSTHCFVSDAQMILELRDMVAHGCTNPNFYNGIRRLPDGSLDYGFLEHRLSLRERAGVPKGDLFLPDNPLIITRKLEPGEYEQNIAYAQEIQAWATARGYGQVFFTGADEAGGQALLAEHEAFKSVEEAGSGIWVATPPSFHELVWDVLEIPIVAYPGMIAMNNSLEHLKLLRDIIPDPKPHRHCQVRKAMTTDWQNLIAIPHSQGFRFFQYFDSWLLPGEGRRSRGFGMWLTGVDGTMTWSYAGIKGNGRVREAGESIGHRNMVMRVKGGVLVTLNWVAYREGYDDSRYIATLLAAGGESWLEAIPHERIFEGNLDELRRKTAEEILRLKGE